jgi:[protein-PII] uridylyltransferase
MKANARDGRLLEQAPESARARRQEKVRDIPEVHVKQVLAHAERGLATTEAVPPGGLAGRLPAYKRFLKIENHRLRLAHQAGDGGREICRRRVLLLDIFLRQLFEDASQACPGAGKAGAPQLAMLAIGGYGRGELNPYSDIDLLFLHEYPQTKVPPHVNEFIKQVLYVLWDIGFKVGHATRSIRDACEHANHDNVSKTALLEARYLAGQQELFTAFLVRFEKACIYGQDQAYIQWRRDDQLTRHLKYGPTVFLQEPNVKTSPGGLRDYHNLLWSAYFIEHAGDGVTFMQRNFMNESEQRRLERAYDFLLRVRTDLHYLTRRSADVLSLPLQSQIAGRFRYPQKNILRRSEAFMRDYYHHARAMALITQTLFTRLVENSPAEATVKPTSKLRRLFNLRPTPAAERFDGFIRQDGLIYPEKPDVFDKDPFRMLRVFEHAQTLNLRLSSELQQLIRARLPLVANRTFQYARAAREIFIAILSHRGDVGRILRAMHEVDLLGAYLPEFGELTCLVQHEFFHRYSADEHTLVCIEKLDQLLDPANTRVSGYRRIFEKLKDPFTLYLALLLHDTGKATSARHHSEASAVFAQKVATRLQLSSERRRSLVLLVDNHLTLSSTSQRRNLDDPATIIEFSNIVKDRANLDALMLLTLADGQGTSDDAWSDWKESLVWELYNSSRTYLAEGESAYLRSRRQRESQRRAVAADLDSSFAEEIDAHFQWMPDRYFETFDAASIAGHLRLVREFEERLHAHDDSATALAPAVRWKAQPERGHTECWVCTWERRDLFAKIAGSFAAASLSIFSADIYTRADNLAFDIFRVSDLQHRALIEPRDVHLVENTLQQALQVEKFDFTPLLQKARRRRRPSVAGRVQELDFPTRIVITNEATNLYTLLEVQTPDRMGLLYDLLRALGKLGINIVLSRIATEKGAATDSFYLTNQQGERIADPALEGKIQAAIQQAAVKGT